MLFAEAAQLLFVFVDALLDAKDNLVHLVLEGPAKFLVGARGKQRLDDINGDVNTRDLRRANPQKLAADFLEAISHLPQDERRPTRVNARFSHAHDRRPTRPAADNPRGFT
jgi:hypothetical protein